jgi:hypothetical protein
MTSDEFRRIALAFTDSLEGSHMGHPDFRTKGKIFASLGPDLTWGMAKLTPEQQMVFMSYEYKGSFKPASGKWGDGGATLIVLANVTAEMAGEALTLAWRNVSNQKR